MLPHCIQRWIVRGIVEEGMSEYSPADKEANALYFQLHASNRSDTDRLMMMQIKAGLYYHKLSEQKFECPVAICFGSRDFLGSEGADQFIKNNKHFSSGQS